MLKNFKNLTLLNRISALMKAISTGRVRKSISSRIIIMVFTGMLGIMAGCGVDNGGGDVVTDATIVTGTASKGILYPGTISIFAVYSGVKSSAPLKTVQTDQ